jgi:myosin heavy subunit
MNPFKWLPIYGEEVIKQYHNRPYGSLEPHCFMEAEDAYQNLVKTRLNQAVVICGESGAGKTETTKLMLQYLSVISKRYEGGDAAAGMTMGEKIVESNPLMEAFGNAKTLRNNNSSRFGKFTSLHYTQKHTISGCHITNLLLEKSRVVVTAEGERNYHIFYQIQTAKNLAALKLSGDPNNERYTNQSGCTEVTDMDDAEEYDLTVASMKAVDISDAEVNSVMNVVAAIINIGNLKFTASDPAQLDGSTSGSLANACALLGVPVAQMQQALVTRVRELPGGEKVTTNNSQAESVSLRDAVSKSVYSKLFDWIVVRINKTLDVDPASNPQFIGILDIFGFEDMKVNGFEQLFINTTNEMLQKVFNDIIFKKEEEEYTREQIAWDKTVFPDNDPCIHLLTKKPIGLLPYIDSECQRGMAASEGADLVRKFNKSHNGDTFYEVCGPSTVWRRKDNTRTQNEDFLIHHFAGPIIYTCSEFIDKNRDALFGHVYDILSASSVPLVQDLYPPREDDVAASKMTVGNRFLGQLNQLVKMLRESESRFVRCIKTNNTFAPAIVDKMSVLRQLVCSGVMAALEVRRAGFPSRMPYRDFVREFRVFTPRGVCRDDQELCGKMLHHPHVRERVTEDSYRLGTTKLFMQADVLYTLQSIKNRIIYPVVRRLQIWWIKLQGDIMNRKLTRGTNLLTKLANAAEVGGVQHVGFIVKAIADMREKQAAASANLSAETIAALMKSCDSTEQLVDKAIAQKEEAYRIRAEILGVLDGYTSRLNAVKASAETLYDARAKELLKGECEKAEVALNESRQEQMTAANS